MGIVDTISNLGPIHLGIFTSLFVIAGSKTIIDKKLSNDIKKIKDPKPILDKPVSQIQTDFIANHITDPLIDNCIVEFKNVIEGLVDKKYLTAFYRNINDLKVRRRINLNVFDKVAAYYNSTKNEIVLLDSRIRDVVFHELFHLASSYINNEGEYIGFFQKNGKSVIGEGINEGCTEWAAKEYFPGGINSYSFQTYVFSHIAKIIGDKKIFELYFQADLKGLINEMSKYLDVDEVFTIINGLDLYTKLDRKIIQASFLKFCHDYIENIQGILLKMYINKHIDSFNDISNIDIKQYAKDLDYTIYASDESFTYYLDDIDISKVVNKKLHLNMTI